MTLKALGGRKLDRRSLRSQRMLREALAEELTQAGDLSRVTVAALTERAGLTRRTFYSHYKDIPDFIERVEGALLDEVRAHVEVIAAASLDDLYRHIEDAVPAPGSVELLRYLKENGALIGALLGPGGDQAFIEKVTCMAREVVPPGACRPVSCPRPSAPSSTTTWSRSSPPRSASCSAGSKTGSGRLPRPWRAS